MNEDEKFSQESKFVNIPNRNIGTILCDTIPHFLDRSAEHLNTADRQLNGLDITSYTVSSLATLCKAASMLLQLTSVENNLNSQISNLHKSAKQIEKEVESLPTELRKNILPKTDDYSFNLKSQSLRDINGFLDKGDIYLKEISQNLAITNKIKKSANDNGCNLVFDSFNNFLKAKERLERQPSSEIYKMRGKQFCISLTDSKSEKSIEIKSKKGELIYQSKLSDDTWQVSVDNLKTEEKLKILKLPQTEKEIINHILSKYFISQIEEKIKDNGDLIKWKYQDNREYEFNLVKKGDSLFIEGKDENRKVILLASRSQNNHQFNLIVNKIPIEHLEKFVKWNQQSKKSQQSKNSYYSARK